MLSTKPAPRPHPPSPDACFRHLTPPRQRLVRLAQQLGFGTIRGLRVLRGDPVLAPAPTIVRKRKNTCADSPRPQRDADDFALKGEWVRFFNDLDAIDDGTILAIEVAHGLPIIHEYEDVIDV